MLRVCIPRHDTVTRTHTSWQQAWLHFEKCYFASSQSRENFSMCQTLDSVSAMPKLNGEAKKFNKFSNSFV